MKRQAKDTQSLVYAYGCKAPIEGLDHLLDEQLRQRAMWDHLVRSDRLAARAQWDSARTDADIDRLVTEIDALSADIDASVTARRSERAKARSKVDTPGLDARIADLSGQRRDLKKDLWPRLKDWRKANKDLLTSIEAQRRADCKAIRQGSGLYWGNYNRVLQSFDTARKLAMKRGGSPRFSDHTRRDGVLTVQFTRTASGLGASWEEITGGKAGALRIDPVQLDHPTRGERKRAARTELTMRIDAAGHHLRVPAIIHRLPPPGARIKQAQLTWRHDGGTLRWQIAFTLSLPRADLPANPSRRAVGIDLGWRLQPDGSLLIATLVDDRQQKRICLPARWMTAVDQVERLQKHLDSLTLDLAQHWHNQVADLPDDLRQPLMAWRPKLGAGHVDSARLIAAVRARIESVRGTEARADVPETIRFWYDRTQHLSIWRDSLRAKLQRQRREIYRLVAKRIAENYAVIGLEDFDLSLVAKTKQRDPETGDNPLHAAARAQRQRACVHSFRAELEHQAAKNNAEIVIVPGKTTQTCHACGDLTKPPSDRADQFWTCTRCGTVWDQDLNAAENLRRAASGEPTSIAA